MTIGSSKRVYVKMAIIRGQFVRMKEARSPSGSAARSEKLAVVVKGKGEKTQEVEGQELKHLFGRGAGVG